MKTATDTPVERSSIDIPVRAVTAATIGTALEWFDFALYGVVSATAYCSKSPHASCGNSFVVIQDATQSRAPNDGSALTVHDRARRDQFIAQPLMIALEVMMGDILALRTMQHATTSELSTTSLRRAAPLRSPVACH
jgi:hypothetical protein